MIPDARQLLVAYLLSDAQVADLIGARIGPGKDPQRAKNPRIAYTQISTQRVISQDGPTGLVRARLQVDCFDLTEQGAAQLAGLVRLAQGSQPAVVPADATHSRLHGFRGTVNDIPVQGVFEEDERDHYWPPVHNDDVGIYEVSLDLYLWFLENAPNG